MIHQGRALLHLAYIGCHDSRGWLQSEQLMTREKTGRSLPLHLSIARSQHEVLVVLLRVRRYKLAEVDMTGQLFSVVLGKQFHD